MSGLSGSGSDLFTRGEETHVPTGEEAEWAPELDLDAVAKLRFLGLVHSLVTIMTELSQVSEMNDTKVICELCIMQ